MNVEEAADPVTAEIIRHAMVAITDEMKTNLMRTAYNLIIYEALDFTVGLFDECGKTISIGLGLPMFIRGLSDTVKAMIEHYGPGGIEPGDVLLTNDAYITGSHLNHIVLTVPIFSGAEIVAYASTMAHWMDIGGSLGNVTRDIYSEGLQIPFVKLFKRGVQDREITNMIAMNVRFPDLAMGDLRAQIASIFTGERRYVALVERYGLDRVNGSLARIAATSERLARAAVTRIPDGIYSAEAFMDDDGVGSAPIPVRADVEVRGDHMTIDLSRMSPQVAGFFNSGATAGVSAAQIAFMCLVAPGLRPINDGVFRPLDVVLPPGSVISATKPAPMRWWMTIPMTVVDVIFRALQPAVPNASIAGHHADLCVVEFNGIDPGTGRFYMSALGVPGGGWGAKHNEDGVSATVCINDGDTHNSPVEATEIKTPVLIESLELRPDSGGAGRYRGGLGVSRRARALGPMSINTQIERTKCPPWGIAGGLPGAANRVMLERAGGETVAYENGKIRAQLAAGDTFIIEAGGGGGYGNPHDRDRDRLLDDVRAGYVTQASAISDYGLEPSELPSAGRP
jgi:N-methylhydantoinase B